MEEVLTLLAKSRSYIERQGRIDSYLQYEQGLL